MDCILKIKSSVHGHTKYCNHSDIEPEWLVIKAKEMGFKEFTISEHIPYEKDSPYRPTMKVWNDVLYKKLVELQEKYNDDDFKLFISIESEYFKKDHQFYFDFFNKYNLDFAIFGNHHYGSNLEQQIEFTDVFKDCYEATKCYVKQAIDGFKSNLFIHLAHPDFMIRMYNFWDHRIEKLYKKLIKKAIKYNISLGFNVNGYYSKNKTNPPDEYYYPVKKFWDLVKNTKAKVRIECDIHHVKLLDASLINNCYDYAIELGLKNNLIDEINLPIKNKKI
ncbi:PHP domain-containing protein [Malacoplasma iowae]|uniref:PHP domain-containing protein n=1 Tax=Malacoplasma iowae TaxID=2116 RepID=UPI002A18CC89|nr:PHP domain-containing protein [Malacoplasma iowae]WPL40014.1 PHP domain-containing protein [Malacoplasma iowae]